MRPSLFDYLLARDLYDERLREADERRRFHQAVTQRRWRGLAEVRELVALLLLELSRAVRAPHSGEHEARRMSQRAGCLDQCPCCLPQPAA